jgi:hypothetical protein
MSTDRRGKVKEKLWNRPICADESDPLRLRRKARRDFQKEHYPEDDEGASGVASTDVLDESWELVDPPLPDSDFGVS